jgi:hypothetical protein
MRAMEYDFIYRFIIQNIGKLKYLSVGSDSIL